MEISELKSIIDQYGMPIIVAGGLGYFIFFVWKFVTEKINTELAHAKKAVIGLVDKIRMLDNDIIRLEQKLNTALKRKTRRKPRNK